MDTVLPENCVVHILSLMTPCEACRLASVCRTFRSAVNSNVLWKAFLPEYWEKELFYAGPERPPPGSTTLSSKDIFFQLYRRGVHVPYPFLGTGEVRFIYTVNGATQYFVGMVFVSASWELKPMPLDPSSYLEVTHEVETSIPMILFPHIPEPCVRRLTLEKTYGIYFVFQLRCSITNTLKNPVQLRFYIEFGEMTSERQKHILVLNPHDLNTFQERADGWMEVEMTKLTPPTSSIRISYHLEERPPYRYRDFLFGQHDLEVRPILDDA